MPKVKFSKFIEANNFAKTSAKSGKSVKLLRDETGFVVSIDEINLDYVSVATDKKISIKKFENELETRETQVKRTEISYLQITKKSMKDFSNLIINKFSGCDKSTLIKIHNRFIELDADAESMTAIKFALQKFEPIANWVIKPGFGGSNDDIKKMNNHNLEDIRKRGRI
jgi:hypothetical protein